MFHACRTASILLTTFLVTAGRAAADDPAKPRALAALPAHVLRQLATADKPDPIHAVAFAPDGKTVAAAGNSGMIYLWDAATGKRVRSFQAHEGAARTLAFSPDGKGLASGGNDRTLRLWDAASGRELWNAVAHLNDVATLAFSPDGKVLASGGGDKFVRLWNVANGKETSQLIGNGLGVLGVAFAPDGKVLGSAGVDRSVVLWDVKSATLLHRLTSHKSWVHCLAFTKDDGIVISGSRDQNVRFWDVESGKRFRSMGMGHWDSDVFSLAVIGRGRLVASGDNSATIRIWDVTTGQQVSTWTGHKDGVHSVAVSPDGAVLASGGSDGAVFLWDLKDVPAVAVQAKEPGKEVLETYWGALNGANDSDEACIAERRMVASARQSLPFLKERLTPVSKDEGLKMAQLIKDLDSDSFGQREQAEAELIKRGGLAVPVVRKTLQQPLSSLEMRRRLERVLEKLPVHELAWRREREKRAIAVLVRIGTPEARQVLEEIAKGAPEAPLTGDARAGLDQMDRKESGR